MGGLFSTYAVCRYPHIFSKAAALSSSYWFNQTEIEALLQASDLSAIRAFYLDCGTQEGIDDESKLKFIRSNQSIHEILKGKVSTIKFEIVSGAAHNVTAFQQRMANVITFLDFDDVIPEEES